MNVDERINAVLNKGAKQETEQKEEYVRDERFLTINTRKATLPENLKDETELNYEFCLVPFSEGVNYLPLENISAVYKDGVMTKGLKQRLCNFYTNEYIKKEHGKIRYNHLKDIMFNGTSAKKDTINDPLGLYESDYFDNIHYNVSEDERKKYRIGNGKTVLCQVLVIEDPIYPENNGKIKIFNIKTSLYDNLLKKQEEYNKKTIKDEAKDIKELRKDEVANKDKIEKLLDIIDDKTIDIFDASKTSLFTLTIQLIGDNPKLDDIKDIYSNVMLEVTDNPLDIKCDKFSLVDLVQESKDRYVGKKLFDNLTSLGWREDRIFEYKAFFDLYNHVKDEPIKLNQFNKINKYNFDIDLFTKENHVPSISLDKAENLDQVDDTPSNIEKEVFKAPASSIDSIDDLDDEIPF